MTEHDIAAGDPTVIMGAEILTIHLHDRSYRMYDTGGKISRCMRAGIPYEHGLLESIYDRTQEGRFGGLAVDVGANIGNHTLWMAVMCGLKVAAIEPVTVEMLYANLELNGLNNSLDVSVFPIGVGASTTELQHQGKGRLRLPSESHLGTIIEVKPLDDLDLRAVSLIKIDVEGMEADVLRGARRTISRDRPVIYAEFWDDEHFEDITRVLAPLGYRLTRVFEMGTDLGCWESI